MSATLPCGLSSPAASLPVRPSSPVKEGELVAGKYRIEHVIAWGGMGVVCSAEDLEGGTRVALKVLRSELAALPVFDARLTNEAHAIGSIRSEYVARLLDIGRLESGLPYFVMEYLEGPSLDIVLRSEGPLPVHTAVAYVLQAGEALAEAHSNGVTHRDVKPENLVLSHANGETAVVKLIDFGISKMTSDATTLTRPGESLGSPCYMAPEQIVSASDVDARADIWSLGVVLYELLAGERPFDGGSLAEVCSRVLHAPVPSLRAKRPDVPVRLERAILGCLERNPARRFRNIAEVRRAITPYARAYGVSPISEPPPPPVTPIESKPRSSTRAVVFASATGVFIMTLLGLVGARLSLADPSPQHEPEKHADALHPLRFEPRFSPMIQPGFDGGNSPRSSTIRGPAPPRRSMRLHSVPAKPSAVDVVARKDAYRRYLESQRLRRVGDVYIRIKPDGTTELVE